MPGLGVKEGLDAIYGPVLRSYAHPCLSVQVVSLPEYQTWLRGFPEGTKHILAAAWTGYPILESSAELQARLNAVAPQFFPLHLQRSSPAPGAGAEGRDSNVISGENLLRIHLRPKRDDPLDSSKLLPQDSTSGRPSLLSQIMRICVQEARAL